MRGHPTVLLAIIAAGFATEHQDVLVDAVSERMLATERARTTSGQDFANVNPELRDVDELRSSSSVDCSVRRVDG